MYISCKTIYKAIIQELKIKCQGCPKPPNLGILTFRNNKGSESYIKGIKETCDDIGIKQRVELVSDQVTQTELNQHVKYMDLNYDGVILQLPVPKPLSIAQASRFISPQHDIDGFTKNSPYIPATAKGIIMLLDRIGINYNSQNCIMIGRSKHIGRAVAKELLNRNCTTTICHSYTDDLTYYTKHGDIIICAVGIPNFLKPDMVKENSIIIDVGVNISGEKIVGDVSPECSDIADITQVPGGTGLLTRAALISNLLESN